MKSKTIILQSQTQDKSGRAILTLTQENDLLITKMRLYNFKPLNAQAKLGIYHNQQVYSANMLFKDGAYQSSLVGDFDMNTDFYCGIVDTEHDNTPLLAGGTYGGYYFNDTSVITNNLNQSFTPQPEPAARETAPAPDQPAPAREPIACNQCANCKYKEFFFNQQSQCFTPPEAPPHPTPATQTQTQPSPESPQPATAPTILQSLIPQFDYIFKTFPECAELNKAIENSRFVKITEADNTYCLGAIYKNDQPEYICYAVPSAYNTPAPEELGAHHQWLPLDPTDPLSDGYHIVYQDAHDLKIVEL